MRNLCSQGLWSTSSGYKSHTGFYLVWVSLKQRMLHHPIQSSGKYLGGVFILGQGIIYVHAHHTYPLKMDFLHLSNISPANSRLKIILKVLGLLKCLLKGRRILKTKDIKTSQRSYQKEENKGKQGKWKGTGTGSGTGMARQDTTCSVYFYSCCSMVLPDRWERRLSRTAPSKLICSVNGSQSTPCSGARIFCLFVITGGQNFCMSCVLWHTAWEQAFCEGMCLWTVWEFKSMYFYSVLLKKTACAGCQPRRRRAGQEVFNHSLQAWPSQCASTALIVAMSHLRPYHSQIICSLWQEGFLREGSGAGVVQHRSGWWWRSDISRLAVQIFIAPLLIYFFSVSSAGISDPRG